MARGAAVPVRRPGAVASVLAAGLLLPLGPAAASERDDLVGLSVDGRVWERRLEEPLVEPAVRWVPGHVEEIELLARNQSGSRATGWADVVITGGGQLPSALVVRTRIGDGPWTVGPRSHSVHLAPDQVVPVRAEIAFDPAAGNDTQAVTAGLAVRVTLADPGAVGPGQGSGPGGGDGADGADAGAVPPSDPGSLAPTGAVVPAVVTAAGFLVLLGTALLAFGRRRRGTG